MLFSFGFVRFSLIVVVGKSLITEIFLWGCTLASPLEVGDQECLWQLGWFVRLEVVDGFVGARRWGSRSSARVASVPGAKRPDNRAWRAADSSPRCTRSRALLVLLAWHGLAGFGGGWWRRCCRVCEVLRG